MLAVIGFNLDELDAHFLGGIFPVGVMETVR